MSSEIAAGGAGQTRAASRAPGGELRLRLTRSSEAPAAARAALAEWCAVREEPDLRREILLLLVSEIVTNAVLHARAPAEASIELAVSLSEENADTIHVDVSDGGEGFTPTLREPTGPGGGYGLYLLEQQARSWGVDSCCGRRVWFEL